MSKKSPIPLRAKTSCYYIKQLGHNISLKQLLLQLYIQHTTRNAVNGRLFLISLILLIL